MISIFAKTDLTGVEIGGEKSIYLFFAPKPAKSFKKT
jgi:hypothetical protein